MPMGEAPSTSASHVTGSAPPLASGIARATLDRVRAGSLAVDIAFVSAVALALGLIRLGTPSFWVDEAFTAWRVHHSFLELTEGYHWLYGTIIKPWAFVTGTSEEALRLPSVFGAMLGAALLVVLARRLFDRWVALASGLLLATSPFIVKWSQQARAYSLLVPVCLIATLLLLRALERGSSRAAWVVYGLAFTAVVVWHPVAGLVLVPSHAILFFQRREQVLPHGLLAAVVICALAVPWAGQIFERSTGGSDGLARGWLRAPTPTDAVRTLLDVSGAAGLGLVLAVGGLVVLVRSGSLDRALWLGTWAFAPFVVTLAVSPVRPLYLDRYLMTAAPAFALLGGIAVTRLGRRLRTVAVAAAVVATSLGLVTWYTSSDRGGNWRGENWREAIATVGARSGESDALVVVPWSVRQAATYYGANVSGASTAKSIWVVTWSETGEEMTAADRRMLGFGDHELVERIQFGWRVSAQLWRRP
jgi:mannosyltransferase